MRRGSGAVACLVVVTILAGVVVGTSGPAPTKLCGICEYDDYALGEESREIELGNSSVAVDVYRNGSSRWTERVELDSHSARVFEANREERQRFVRRANDRNVVHDPEQFQTSVADQTLVVRYWVTDSARSWFDDVLLFTHFHHPLEDYTTNTDRLLVRGPPGMTVANEPPTGTVENDSVRYGDSLRRSDGYVTSSTYIAFASRDGDFVDAKVKVSIAFDLLPLMLDHAVSATWFVVIFWVLAALGLTWSRGADRPLWVPLSVHQGLTGEGQHRDAEEAPSTSASVLLVVGWLLLVLIPIIGLFGPWRFVPGAVGGMLLAFWIALGLVKTLRQCWITLLGIACGPVAIVFPLTPLGGLGEGLLAFSIGYALMLWPAIGMLCYYLARTVQTWNEPQTPPRLE